MRRWLLFLLVFVASPAMADLVGHGGPVRGLDVSPDGRRVLTASFDYSLILWDLGHEAELHRLIGHDAAVNAAAFLPDGRRAVSGSDDGTLIVWDLDTGAPLRRLAGHEGKIADVAVSPNGRLAASAGWDRAVRLWDLESGQEIRRFDGHEGNVNAVAFLSKDRIASAGYDGSLRVWSADGGADGVVEPEGLPINAMAVTADGRLAATAGVDEAIRIWDLDTGARSDELFGHEGPVFALAVSPDGSLLASGGADGRVRLWRRTGNGWERDDIPHDGPVWALAFSPDGGRLLSAGIDDVARIWDTRTAEPVGRSVVARSAAVPALGRAEGGGEGRGAQLFARCRACHTLSPDDGRRAGPTLYGVMGRRAGSLPGYPYSPALRNSHLVWTPETLDALLSEGPQEVIPGNKMPLQTITDPAERRALIRFLAEASTAPLAPAEKGGHTMGGQRKTQGEAQP